MVTNSWNAVETYITFLRGINVSGQKPLKMAELRQSLEGVEFQEVKTYIQSGNLVFKSPIGEVLILEEKIKNQILADFGFELPTLVTKAKTLQYVLGHCPFDLEAHGKQCYFVLLKQPPEPELVKVFNALTFENEDFYVTDVCVYLHCWAGYGKAKLNNNFVEGKLKVQATTRNLKTLQKMIAMANV